MVSIDLLVSLVPLFPLVGFLLVALAREKFTQGVTSWIACGAVLLSFITSVYLFIFLQQLPADERTITVVLFDWIKAGSFTSSISFLLDPLSSIFLLIITGVGFLIHLYSVGYMHHDEGFN